jgi:hypothetical protein
MSATADTSNNNILETTGKILMFGIPILYFLISVAFYLKTYDSAQIKITLMQLGGTILFATWLIRLFEENSTHFFRKNAAII